MNTEGQQVDPLVRVSSVLCVIAAVCFLLYCIFTTAYRHGEAAEQHQRKSTDKIMTR